MSYNLVLDFNKGFISIDNEISRMSDFLARQPRTRIEHDIFMLVKSFYVPKKDVSQLEIEYDDISELVASDMAKGDNHSKCLL